MKFVFALVLLFGGAVLYMLNGEPQYDDTLIAHFPVDSKADMTRNLTKDPHTIDRAVSSDGNGSLRIDATHSNSSTSIRSGARRKT